MVSGGGIWSAEAPNLLLCVSVEASRIAGSNAFLAYNVVCCLNNKQKLTG